LSSVRIRRGGWERGLKRKLEEFVYFYNRTGKMGFEAKELGIDAHIPED